MFINCITACHGVFPLAVDFQAPPSELEKTHGIFTQEFLQVRPTPIGYIFECPSNQIFYIFLAKLLNPLMLEKKFLKRFVKFFSQICQETPFFNGAKKFDSKFFTNLFRNFSSKSHFFLGISSPNQLFRNFFSDIDGIKSFAKNM